MLERKLQDLYSLPEADRAEKEAPNEHIKPEQDWRIVKSMARQKQRCALTQTEHADAQAQDCARSIQERLNEPRCGVFGGQGKESEPQDNHRNKEEPHAFVRSLTPHIAL
jgi:hypothetical protein